MAQLSKGKTFSSGDTVTASDLNNLVDDGTIVDLAVTTAKLAANSVTEAKLGTDVDSDSLNFLQSGTGAAARTIQAKLRDTVSVKDFGATGDGTTDDTAAIQAAIDSLSRGTVFFPNGNYRTTDNVELKSYVDLQGQGARFTCTASWEDGGTFLSDGGVAVYDIEISGFTFDGGGSWSATAFDHPYDGGSSNTVGFNNGHIGITASNASRNINIHDNIFKGLEAGLEMGNCYDLRIVNNDIQNCGKGGIYMDYARFCVIANNTIRGVYGNLTDAGVTDTANSKYADGIYTTRCEDVAITGNTIEDICRCGVVLESDSINLGKRISVIGNTFKLMQGSRGTEINAAVWSEPLKNEDSCVASGNTMDNTGASEVGYPTGASYNSLVSRGIQADDLTVTGNYIRGFGLGITGSKGFNAAGNTVDACSGVGITINTAVAGEVFNINGNLIHNNEEAGIDVYRSHGTISIHSNTIKDNGQKDPNVTASMRAGIRVSQYYDDQYLSISSNTFFSSADEDVSVGQLYGICATSGGDFNYDNNKTVVNNAFRFTGTFTSTYPDNLDEVPVGFAYDNTSTVAYGANYEIGPSNNMGNINDKFVLGDFFIASTGGQLDVGYAIAAPLIGTYRKGDIFYNSDVSAGEYLGWICVTAGTPGTWKGFGAIES